MGEKTPNDTDIKMKKRALKLQREMCQFTDICFMASMSVNQ